LARCGASRMSIETKEGALGYPAYQHAVSTSEAITKKLERLSDNILVRRVKTWQDLLLLAELAAAHDADCVGVVCEEGGEVMYVDRAHQALAALLKTVLQLGHRTRFDYRFDDLR
jgi:hypothetical protein